METLLRWISQPERVLSCNISRTLKNYSAEDIQTFINHIEMAWWRNELSPAALHALLKLANIHVARNNLKITFINNPPIPICYFSPLLPPAANLLRLYLNTVQIDVNLFSLQKSNRRLLNYVRSKRPPAVLFTVPHFMEVKRLTKIVKLLIDKNLVVFLGGIPFVYHIELKEQFTGCVFPRDLGELAVKLNSVLAVN